MRSPIGRGAGNPDRNPQEFLMVSLASASSNLTREKEKRP